MLFSQVGVILITPTYSSLGLGSLNKGELLDVFHLTNRYLCNRKACESDLLLGLIGIYKRHFEENRLYYLVFIMQKSLTTLKSFEGLHQERKT